jgi:hypothetical protein
MQRSFDWSEHTFWKIRGTGLTSYIEKCKCYLTDQEINQRHWAHQLCFNMQRTFDWSKHHTWEIRGTGLTSYVEICKGHSTDWCIPSDKSEALDSPAVLEHAKVIWLIRTSLLKKIRGFGLTFYIGKCKSYLTEQEISKRHWAHPLCLNMQRTFDWSEHHT